MHQSILHGLSTAHTQSFLCPKPHLFSDRKGGKQRYSAAGVPANNFLFARRVPANNFLNAGRVPANNFLNAGRVPANNFLFAGRVLANNLFQNQMLKLKKTWKIKVVQLHEYTLKQCLNPSPTTKIYH